MDLQPPVWFLQMRKWLRLGAKRKPAPFAAGWQPRFGCISTTVRVDDPGLHESHFEVVQNCRFVQVAESSQVVLSHQDVRVAKGGQLRLGRVQGVVAHLCSGAEESADLCFSPPQLCRDTSMGRVLLTAPFSRSSSRALSPTWKSSRISADFHTCSASRIHTLFDYRTPPRRQVYVSVPVKL